MNMDDEALIHGYFEGSLTREQAAQLNDSIKADPEHARQFASSAMLHDRLRAELVAFDGSDAKVMLPDDRQSKELPMRQWRRRSFAMVSAACVLLLVVSLVWQTVDAPPASAAMIELNRIIEANQSPLDRSFVISVLDVVIPPQHQDPNSPERRRLPKPSLDDAVLDVRGSDQIVLKRKTRRGDLFVTGRNETTSWAVRPDGPVRYSDNLKRFARELPGHEDGLPINNLHDGLVALPTGYDVQWLPRQQTQTSDQGSVVDRRMIAIRKPGFRGAKRIEIRYVESSGKIRQLRYEAVSYGPERITLVMRATDEHFLPASYFDHSFHHGPERVVEFE